MTSINDSDTNGFMTAINWMDRKKGLDLAFHISGDGLEASEALVDWITSMCQAFCWIGQEQQAECCGWNSL